MNITQCGNRGKFYYPRSTQADHISDAGVLDLTQDINSLFDLQVAVDCAVDPSTKTFEYINTKSHGWYILFQPIENDNGAEYNSIRVEYDDNSFSKSVAVPIPSQRTITILAVNDVPVFSVPLLGTDQRVNIYGEQTEIVLLKGRDQNFGIRVSDTDARVSDKSEFPGMKFQLAITSIVLNDPKKTVAADTVLYGFDSTGSEEVTIVPQTSATEFGFLQFTGSVSQINAVLTHVTMTFAEVGTYTFEVVALDAGYLGVCPPGLVKDTTVYPASDIRVLGGNGTLYGTGPETCNTVSVVKFTVQAQANTLVTAGAATAAGAAAAAILAAAAVAFAKFKKPEDLDAWQALDGAMGGNAMSSGIHVAAGTSGQSALYSGK
jgi:hypothetical protein